METCLLIADHLRRIFSVQQQRAMDAERTQQSASSYGRLKSALAGQESAEKRCEQSRAQLEELVRVGL